MHIFWVLYFEIVEGLTLLCDHFSHIVLSTVVIYRIVELSFYYWSNGPLCDYCTSHFECHVDFVGKKYTHDLFTAVRVSVLQPGLQMFES